MEYYKGILFLTTNRAGHLDDSCISRITAPIAYHSLSPENKAKIVKRFIRKFEEAGTVDIEQSGQKHMINHCEDLNGRQIRNVLQNAVALAEVQQHGESYGTAQPARSSEDSDVADVVIVKLYHIKAAVERQMEFMSYLDSLKGRDETARARAKQDYLPTPPRVRDDRDQ